MAFKKIEITQGSDVDLDFYFKDKKQNAPLNMSAFTSATLKLRKTDTTLLSVTGSLVSADLAKVRFSISDTNSALLKIGADQDFHVELVRGSDVQKRLFEKTLTVKAPLS